MEILGVEVLTRRRLYERIWSNTVRRTAAELGVKSSELSRACKLHMIPIPTSGHWTLVHMNRVSPWQALPQPNLDMLIKFDNGRPNRPDAEFEATADENECVQVRALQAQQAREIEKENSAQLARKRELKAEERLRHLKEKELERQLKREERERRRIARAVQDELDLKAARALRVEWREKRQQEAL